MKLCLICLHIRDYADILDCRCKASKTGLRMFDESTATNNATKTSEAIKEPRAGLILHWMLTANCYDQLCGVNCYSKFEFEG